MKILIVILTALILIPGCASKPSRSQILYEQAEAESMLAAEAHLAGDAEQYQYHIDRLDLILELYLQERQIEADRSQQSRQLIMDYWAVQQQRRAIEDAAAKPTYCFEGPYGTKQCW